MFEKVFEKYWKKANWIWRRYVVSFFKQLFCRHEEAVHSKAFCYDANPPHNRLRWGVMQRPACPKCGKILGKGEVVRDGMSRAEVAKFMRRLERQQMRDFN